MCRLVTAGCGLRLRRARNGYVKGYQYEVNEVSVLSFGVLIIVFILFLYMYVIIIIPVAAWSKVCGRALAGIVGSNPTGAWMFISRTVSVLSGRSLCDGPILRSEESYRLWCVFECDQVKIKTLYTYCEQVDRRRKDYKTKRNVTIIFSELYSVVLWINHFCLVLLRDGLNV
jgi:hypothetical protein